MDTVPAKIIKKAEYDFMLENPMALISRFEYKEPKKKPESESIVAKLFDHNASFTVADAKGTFTPPEWWELDLDEIMAGLVVQVFRRRVGKIK